MPKYAFAFLLVALGASSCSQKPAEPTGSDVLATNDFENLDGWLADSPALVTLTKSRAHSGVYSTQAGPGYDFSLGYNNQLSRLAPEWPGKLKVSAWVLLPNDQAAAKLVMEVKSGATTSAGLLWEGLDLTKAVKSYNKWQYVEQTITLPETAKPTSRLLVYLWRADSKQPVYLDDLKISRVK
ncbi:MAG: hypothetical protein M3Y12_08625 [Bacteroidota bacterium]|nr:hypothetical protein [Bacteroidota bacterium]